MLRSLEPVNHKVLSEEKRQAVIRGKICAKKAQEDNLLQEGKAISEKCAVATTEQLRLRDAIAGVEMRAEQLEMEAERQALLIRQQIEDIAYVCRGRPEYAPEFKRLLQFLDVHRYVQYSLVDEEDEKRQTAIRRRRQRAEIERQAGIEGGEARRQPGSRLSLSELQ